MRRIIYIIFIFLYFYFNVNAVCEDTLKLFENYFNNTGTDSPAYNFSVIFANMEKINTRSSLEKKIEEIVFILIEQEPELDLFYLGIPINYEENSLNKTLNLAYKNKNITINVKYELIKTYRFNDIYTTVVEIRKKMKNKPASMKQSSGRISNRFSQIKLDKNRSIYRFYNIKLPFFLLAGNMSAGKSFQKAKGKVVNSGNVLNVVAGGEKVSIQQGEIAFDLNSLANLPPAPDTLIVISEKPQNITILSSTAEPSKTSQQQQSIQQNENIKQIAAQSDTKQTETKKTDEKDSVKTETASVSYQEQKNIEDSKITQQETEIKEQTKSETVPETPEIKTQQPAQQPAAVSPEQKNETAIQPKKELPEVSSVSNNQSVPEQQQAQQKKEVPINQEISIKEPEKPQQPTQPVTVTTEDYFILAPASAEPFTITFDQQDTSEQKYSEYKIELEPLRNFRPGEYVYPSYSEKSYNGPEIIIIKDNVELAIPGDNSVIDFSKMNFSWKKFDKAVKYRLEIAAGSSFSGGTLYQRELNDIEYSPALQEISGKFSDGKKYIWRVTALNLSSNDISKNDVYYSFIYSQPETSIAAETQSTNETVTFYSPSINSFKIFNTEIESYKNGHTFIKDDLENNAIMFKIKLEKPLSLNTKIKISYDGGEYYYMNIGASDLDYVYEYKPSGDNILKFSFVYEINNEITEIKNFPGLTKEFNYIHKTNTNLIKIMLENYFQSLQSKDRDKYMECIYSDFSGSNEGFTSYSDIRSTISKIFNKQTFLSSSYSNLNVDLKNLERAVITFNFYFKILFENIGLEREIKSYAQLQLIKNNGLWQILNDDNKLFVMEIFAPAPNPPSR